MSEPRNDGAANGSVHAGDQSRDEDDELIFFGDEKAVSILAELEKANAMLANRFPGERTERQPVHTVYGGAHLFKSGTIEKLGQLALKSMAAHAPSFQEFAEVLELPGYESLAASRKEVEELAKGAGAAPQECLPLAVYSRVIEKLKREPIEDFRIDFEDGYGYRSEGEEDADAERCAAETAEAMKLQKLPPFFGIRIKPFSQESKRRSLRTLDVFIANLLDRSGNALPDNFVVTLPKVAIPEQVRALCNLLSILEEKKRLRSGSIKIELMIETASAIRMVEELAESGGNRIRGAHFGTYDFTAECGISAAHQTTDHNLCDFARNTMKMAFAGTGIWLSDGATTILPIAGEDGGSGRVHEAWRIHYRNVYRSMTNGFYQGWDLHPAQLPARFAACYAFFLQSLEAASLRLNAFLNKAAQANLVGNNFDDAATAQGLLNYFLMALNCGAIGEKELVAIGLTKEELAERSFQRIIAGRHQGR